MARKTHNQSEWFLNMDESLWLKGDDTGADDAEFLINTLRLRPGMTVLDAPCGAGRIGIHLAKAGCNVTGVDITENFFRRARRRFKKEGAEGQFLQYDLRKIDFEEQFDSVVNWGGSFGYFSDAEDMDVLHRFVRALKPGGLLAMDCRHREWILRNFYPGRKNGNVTVTNRWNAKTQRAEVVFKRTMNGRSRSYPMFLRLYTPGQFRRLFSRAGLDVKAIYGHIDGGKCTRSSSRMYIIGKKL